MCVCVPPPTRARECVWVCVDVCVRARDCSSSDMRARVRELLSEPCERRLPTRGMEGRSATLGDVARRRRRVVHTCSPSYHVPSPALRGCASKAVSCICISI